MASRVLGSRPETGRPTPQGAGKAGSRLAAVDRADPVVETAQGRLRGAHEGGLEVFRGIPYARPPLGPLRFAAPEPPEPWSGIRDALAFGPTALQRPGMLTRMLGFSAESSEDCLSLNVWTPAADAGRRPVLVWVHGGSFTGGSGSMPVYDGAALAARGDVVVVTLNYRLGALGFISLPGEAPGATNRGLLDQLAALRWVRDNAAAFGGDPERVTVFGESAGAMALGALLSAPAARGLFRGAILQSGGADNVFDRADAERVSHLFFEALGTPADARDALAALPVEKLLEAQDRCVAELWQRERRMAFQPVVDGTLLPRPPLEAVASGDAAHLRLLVGTNLDEQALWAPGDPKLAELDEAALLRRLGRVLPGRDAAGREQAERVVAVYREARRGRASVAPRDLWLAIETDRVFRAPAMHLAASQARHQPDTWAYLFTWKSPALDGALGACHALELPFVFGTADRGALATIVGTSSGRERLGAAMQDAWLAFARGEELTHPEHGDWPRYDAERRATRILGAECRVEEAPFERERRFWDPFQ